MSLKSWQRGDTTHGRNDGAKHFAGMPCSEHDGTVVVIERLDIDINH